MARDVGRAFDQAWSPEPNLKLSASGKGSQPSAPPSPPADKLDDWFSRYEQQNPEAAAVARQKCQMLLDGPVDRYRQCAVSVFERAVREQQARQLSPAPLRPMASPVPPPPPSPPPPRSLPRPISFLAVPSTADYDAEYPQRAREQSLVGKATVYCLVAASGALYRCRLVAEDPPRFGFGQAALRLASKVIVEAPSDADSGAGYSIQFNLKWPPPN
jgi:hypothetical protein